MAFWLAFEAAIQRGCLCFSGGGLNTIARLRLILENQVSVICCTPTYAMRLGETARSEGIDLNNAKVRAVIVGGEPGGSLPRVREKIQQSWGDARVFDHHGMTEAGSISYACPKVPDVLHIIEDSFIPEVIDPKTGVHGAPGESGELVLTNLGRIGSPLLRYRTGDCVKTGMAGKCACGSSELALEGGIIGRLDEMVIVRGVNLYPSAVEEVIRSFSNIAEHRVEIQTSGAMAEVKVLVEPVRTCNEPKALAGEVRKAMKTAFSLNMSVELAPEGSLPRFEVKSKRWVRVKPNFVNSP